VKDFEGFPTVGGYFVVGHATAWEISQKSHNLLNLLTLIVAAGRLGHASVASGDGSSVISRFAVKQKNRPRVSE
jgi:hypothetical protein